MCSYPGDLLNKVFFNDPSQEEAEGPILVEKERA